ncbi:hypothetical protein EYF80_031931 [Liparis tanakae]|uniref:Uncharacterized protein n=1 Tax=Liparis tanakae TaxID=230148 RepID=A0A4Z2GWM1_9TELE|nr:hypothetical protein EYF80_031931 [Liparis tanakae]
MRLWRRRLARRDKEVPVLLRRAYAQHGAVISSCHRRHPAARCRSDPERPGCSQSRRPEDLLPRGEARCLQTRLHCPLWWQTPSIAHTQNHDPHVTKPATSASKKPAESPLARPSLTSKSAKPETPKSASKADAAKKPAAGKAADAKTPVRAKAEGKATPSKDAPRTPGPRAGAAKTPIPKKTVGSSTPTPVKRAPKAAEPGKEVAVAAAAAAAIATVAAAVAGSEGPEPAVEPSAAELMSSPTQAVQELLSEPAPEPERVPTPEPVRVPTPEPKRVPTPEPVRVPTPEPERMLTPEPVHEESPVQVREASPEPLPEPLSQPESGLGAKADPGPASNAPLAAQLDHFKFVESPEESVPCLGTTVMSPPCSPPGPVSPAREPQDASSLLDVQSGPWGGQQSLGPSPFAPQSLVNTMNFYAEEEKENKDQFEAQSTEEEDEEEEEEEDEEKENLFMPTAAAPSAAAFGATATPLSPDASPAGVFTSGGLISPHEKEEAVEKADEEINEDDDEEDEEDDEDEVQRRLGHQPSSLATDMSTSQPSEELQARREALGAPAAWPGDDLLSGLDSEDASSCASSRPHGVSELSSPQHTALLDGTQSSDALVDSSHLMSSPNVETMANEEDEDDEEEEEEEERVDDMDLSSERVEEHHKVFMEQQQQQQQRDEDEEDEDVEMHSEGVAECCGNVDVDEFDEEERSSNLNRSVAPPCVPPASSWGQSSPFSDPWAQPASAHAGSSPSPVSDHGAVEAETRVLSPERRSPREEAKTSADGEEAHAGMSRAAAPRSGSETSTPEELRDYDSSSGVESRSDKQQTPVPSSVQPDMEDLGIHLEKGDGEEEEAETLPADEVLGTGPPTAPASAPSSPSTSGDEASDTEDEMQINDPDAAAADRSAGLESPPPARSLPALEEDEEAADARAGDGEEDGGGTTPQSANSVASYGFDCTTSNSNAHSMAESCGKSPGIFSLENEEQLPEEAKDPSLLKELTLPSPAAAAEDLLGGAVDLMPFGQPGGLDEHHYMLGGKMAADRPEEAEACEPSLRHLGAAEAGDPSDGQPPYYSTICDKTDSFLSGNV